MAEEKSTLLELRRRHNTTTGMSITSKQIADAAGVRVADEFTMELGRPVDPLVANAVLSAYNAISGQQLRFTDIAIALKDPQPGEVRR